MNKPAIVDVVYRHPYSTTKHKVIENMLLCLTDLNRDKSKLYYICGDLNINTSSVNQSPIAEHFINTIVSCVVFPLVTKPTRVTDNSAIIIDHIINNSHQKFFPGVFNTCLISDYCIVYCQVTNICRVQIKKSETPLHFYSRQI